ncbi:Indoleamine 2,3-dioxygenase [Laetiporus sulphureus 93-53]|uniref:Indoleamine 2,3-dioxygenase n=1 Tax=Laetiporus sulphureus 93-53 TaxID=1314785 RepID=A0A165CQQ8_9APHY|nr:Indoleamine 2,3-dioxygenase [Laetiporus sulphureus 93-53]KZT03250.1 Indoleamine 2,3-dioxygenase [Laetiporus sulphureus 93-53]
MECVDELEEHQPNLTGFDIDPFSGFFPPKPLPRLPQRFALWEAFSQMASQALALNDDPSEDGTFRRTVGASWRDAVSAWPIISVDELADDIRLLQRAHMVLASITHFYAHSRAPSDHAILIPKSISVPLVEISRHLRMAPALTFADTQPLSADNIRVEHTFSGTDAEQNFYLGSAAIELRGVEVLHVIEDFTNNISCDFFNMNLYAIGLVGNGLMRLANVIDELSDIFRSLRALIDPHTFFSAVRPWWSGSSSRGPIHHEWVLDGVPATANADLGGPSAGQSSVMHALDIFLDVDHKLEDTDRTPAPSPANLRADREFMERMRRFMPGPHQDYLKTIPSVREAAQRSPELVVPYNAAVMALKRLRDLHIRIVTRYIVTQAHATRANDIRGQAGGPPQRTFRVARGTGGSEVSNLLKAGRDATHRALL